MLCFLPTLPRGNMYMLKRIGPRTWGSHKHDFTMSHSQQDSNLWWWSTQQRLKLSESLSQKICTSLPSRGYRGPHQAKRLKCKHAHLHTLTKLIQWVCWGPGLLERPVGPGKTAVGIRIHKIITKYFKRGCSCAVFQGVIGYFQSNSCLNQVQCTGCPDTFPKSVATTWVDEIIHSLNDLQSAM